MEQFSRTIRLIGEDGFNRLKNSRVVIFGTGGVGSNAAMALCRSGVGNFVLVDMDVVDITNINRQSVARLDTVGQDKVEVLKRDMKCINEAVNVETHKVFLSQDNIHEYLDDKIDYVLDCIDNISCKGALVKICYDRQIPVVSCMGAGNRINAQFEVVDIYKTYNDPVAKIMRKLAKESGIKKLNVVWTPQLPAVPDDGLRTPASVSFAPALAGITMAQYVFNQIIK